MELLNYLAIGFTVALQPVNLFYCFMGVFIGTLVGCCRDRAGGGDVASFAHYV